MKIGVLCVQGAFLEHEKALHKLGVECEEIRQEKDFKNVDGIILPGGESTVQGKLLCELNLFNSIKTEICHGLPTLATCAGLILLAEKIENDNATYLKTLPVTVRRNAYGRQLGSFEANGDVDEIKDFPMVFIRAPYITKLNEGVEILSSINDHIVGVKYQNQIGLSFHPELTNDMRIHEKFLSMV